MKDTLINNDGIIMKYTEEKKEEIVKETEEELNRLKRIEYRKEKFGGDFFNKLYEKIDEARSWYDKEGNKHIFPFGSWYHGDDLEPLVKELITYVRENNIGYGFYSHDIMGSVLDGYFIKQNDHILHVGKCSYLSADFSQYASAKDDYVGQIADGVTRAIPIDFDDFINDRKLSIDRETIESIENPQPKKAPVFYALDGTKFNTVEEAVEYNNSLSNGSRGH